jgi:hypothetical protein
MKQFDIYVSKSPFLKIMALTEAGIKAYNETAYQCLEAGMTIHDITIHDRERLVGSLRKAGYTVTSRVPKHEFDSMSDDELLQELGI